MLQTYELHLTVTPEMESQLRLVRDAEFRVLRFDNFGAGVDVMTSQRLEAHDLEDAKSQALICAQVLEQWSDLQVTRRKLEVEPPPGNYKTQHGQYWETHMRCLGPVPQRMQLFQGARVMWSSSHTDDYVTVRTEGFWVAHRGLLMMVARELTGNHVQLLDADHELVVWDTNRAHDKRWEDACN